MRARLNEEAKMRVLNTVTTNILSNMDNMNISQDDNKINDYTEFLSARTNISKTRLKKMLTMDVVKLITLTDIVQIANAIGIEPKELVCENEISK